MDYKRPLAYPIWPKSGLLPPMDTLRGASMGITNYLPREFLRRPHWLAAGNAVLLAARAEPPSAQLIEEATEALVAALEAEDWMSHPRRLQSLQNQDS